MAQPRRRPGGLLWSTQTHSACIKMMNAKTYTSQNNYDDVCDINAETSLFCGLDYDEFNKTSLSFGPRAHTFKSMTKIWKSSWIVCDCDTFL